MTDNDKWLVELSDFFCKGDNWKTACETVYAVEKVTEYWKELFWKQLKKGLESQVDRRQWECIYEKGNEYIDLYPIILHSKTKSCCVEVQMEKSDGAWFSIWIDKKQHSLAHNSDNYKLLLDISNKACLTDSNDGLFYRPKVIANLYEKYDDRSKLHSLKVNNFKEADDLANKTVAFIKDYKIYDLLCKIR